MLDDAVLIPGTGVRIGLDPLMGLVPGIGDGIAMLFSGFIVFEAARIDAPKRHLLRMTANILIDQIFGSVPVVGDLFDVGWKANRRNMELLRSIPEHVWKDRRDMDAVGRLFMTAVITVFVLAVTVSFALLTLLYRLIAG